MTQEPRREFVGRPHEVQFTDFVENFPSTLPSRASISKIFASISSSVSPVRSRINSHIAWHASVSLSLCLRTSAISPAYRSAFDNAFSVNALASFPKVTLAEMATDFNACSAETEGFGFAGPSANFKAHRNPATMCCWYVSFSQVSGLCPRLV